MDVLTTSHQSDWNALLEEMFQYDFYHTPGYHRIAEERGEGEARLFVFREGGYTIALPLLLRPVPGAEGWRDATSVYGYAGPVASHLSVPQPVTERFWRAVRGHLAESQVVSVFSRLHPLIEQRPLLAPCGETRFSGPTVSIDLTLPRQEQLLQYRTCHLRGIKRLRKMGFSCVEDSGRCYLPRFVEAYSGTMRRVEASGYYFFDLAYFERLFETIGSRVFLFVVLDGTELVCGGVFIACDGILQYHLGGTVERYFKLAPTKLLVDAVRQWGAEAGLRALHLGGGVGAREDSLYHFKCGFSDRRHEFRTWRWIADPARYDALCREASEECGRGGLCEASPDFFPRYRSPRMPDPSLL